MTTGYQMQVTCPRCGGELLPIHEEIHAPDHGTITARCDDCLDVLSVSIAITVTEPWPTDRTDREARRAEGARYAALVEATTF